MDLVLHLADNYVLDKVWAHLLPLNDDPPYVMSSSNFTSMSHTAQSAWSRDYIPRQIISLTVVTLIGIHALYFIFAWLSYKFIFNHDMMRHPRFLENQVKLEIQTSLKAFPVMTLLTLPWFQAEVMGYSKLYDNVEDYGWAYFALSIPWSVFSVLIPTFTHHMCISFLLFTDFGIYWVHRLVHHPSIYKTIHKPHHKWISVLRRRIYRLLAPDCFRSTDPIFLSCFSPRGWLRPVSSISPLHLLIPSSSGAVSRSLRFR